MLRPPPRLVQSPPWLIGPSFAGIRAIKKVKDRRRGPPPSGLSPGLSHLENAHWGPAAEKMSSMRTVAAGGSDFSCFFGQRRTSTSTQRPGVSSSSENSGVAELKEDGQVSCDTAHNLRLTCLYTGGKRRHVANEEAQY